MSEFWQLFIPLSMSALLVGAMVVATVREVRDDNRLNAEADARDEAWRHLTDEDRKWLLENGATRPSFARWGLR